jgi:TonB family protein
MVARAAFAVVAQQATVSNAQAPRDSARCDSMVRSTAAVIDSVPTAVFLHAEEVQGNWMTEEDRDVIESRIKLYFVPPSPFGLSVFQGPALTRGVRISSSGDSLGIPRSASILGVYRVEESAYGLTAEPEVIRASLMRGVDSAMIKAIRTAARVASPFRPASGDLWRFLVRLSVDSIDGSRRLAEGTFPRMRIRDAAPMSKDRPAFPDEARADSVDHGEVVLRFVVDHDGLAALETVELVRSTYAPFTRAALRALATQRFQPATIRGCPVAQVIEFPFIFDDPDRRPPRAS